jgi:hypothetical protein
VSPVRLPWNPLDDPDPQARESLGKSVTRELLDVLTRTEKERVALIGHLRLRDDTAGLAEVLTDLEADDVALRGVVEELRRVS